MEETIRVLIADDHPLVLGALRQAVVGAIPGAVIQEAADFEGVAAALEGEPELVNTDPETGGWLFRLTLSDAGELAGLMDAAAYADYIAGL